LKGGYEFILVFKKLGDACKIQAKSNKEEDLTAVFI
jgi:hypothetical protein